MKKLKVGVIGCGEIARVHVKRLRSINEVSIVAFADIVKGKAEFFSERYGGRAYTDWHDMLNKENLDIVYICIPPFAHSDEVMISAEKGIHIFIEKPIALSMNQAWSMVKAVERSGVKSQVGYCMRFGYAAEKAKELIESGEAGKIGLAIGWYWCHFLGGSWWRDKNKSGGQIVEQSTHLYDMLRYFCGEVDVVYGHMNKIFWTDVPDLTIEDVSSTTFRFKSGAIGSISSTTWGANSQWWFKWIIATEEYTMHAENGNTLNLYSTRRKRVVREWEDRDVYLLEAKDLIRAVLNDEETRTPIRDGAKTLEFTLAARKSMETGKPVKLPLT